MLVAERAIGKNRDRCELPLERLPSMPPGGFVTIHYSWNADEVRVSIRGQEGQHSRRDA
jgi:hypothetical protein